MSGTVNKVILIGRLGDGVKMHYFNKDNCIGRFPLATNETYVNKETGERSSNTDWHTVVVKNKLAEHCENYLNKGDKIYLEGKIKTRVHEIDGVKKYTTEIYANEITFLNLKRS